MNSQRFVVVDDDDNMDAATVAANNELLALANYVQPTKTWTKEDEQVACYQEIAALRLNPTALFADAERVIDRYTRTVGYKFICRAIKGESIENCR